MTLGHDCPGPPSRRWRCRGADHDERGGLLIALTTTPRFGPCSKTCLVDEGYETVEVKVRR